MTDSTPVSGWYPDAANPALMRWWDGSSWTTHVQPIPAAPPETPSVFVNPTPAAPLTTPTHDAHATESSSAPAAAITIAMPPPPEALPRGAVRDVPPGTTASDSLRTAPPPAQRMLTRRELRALGAGTGTGTGESGATPSSPSTPSVMPHGAASAYGLETSSAAASAYASASASASASTHDTVIDGSAPELIDPKSQIPGMVVPSTTGPTGVIPTHLGPVNTRMLSQSGSSTPTLSVTSVESSSEPAVPPVMAESQPPPSYTAVPADTTAAWAPSSTFAVPQSAAEFASVDYEPMGRTWTRPSTSRAPVPERAGTAGAWMLALSPLALVALILAIGVVASGGSASAATALIADRNIAVLGASSLVLVAVSVVYVIIAVVIDRRRLGSLGFTHRPAPGWIVLGPFVYLIARTVRVLRESGRGTAPLWTFLVLSVVLGAASAVSPFVVPRGASLSTMRSVEAQISQDLGGQDNVDRVICPDTADARLGSGFSCEALDADGGVVGIVSARWSSVDGGVEYDVVFGSN